LEEQSYELRAIDYELEDNLGNLENLNKINVQSPMANGYFWIIKERLAPIYRGNAR